MSAQTYGRQVILALTNQSGGGVVAGDVVIIDTAHNDSFTTTTSAATTAVVGVAQDTIANTAVGRVLVEGYAALVNVNASVTRGHYAQTHSVAKQAADAGAARQAGTFAQFLTGGTTPDAMLWPTDLGAGSGGGQDNWTVPLDVWMPLGNTNWNTLNISSADLFNGDVESAGNNTDEMHWDDGFSAGTWTFMLMHVTAANRGIYHVQIDGADVGTIDGWATAPGAKNVISTITGVSISAGKHRTRLIMSTQNGSSSGFFGTIQDAVWRRTA